jgi:hypothetical protein
MIDTGRSAINHLLPKLPERPSQPLDLTRSSAPPVSRRRINKLDYFDATIDSDEIEIILEKPKQQLEQWDLDEEDINRIWGGIYEGGGSDEEEGEEEEEEELEVADEGVTAVEKDEASPAPAQQPRRSAYVDIMSVIESRRGRGH